MGGKAWTAEEDKILREVWKKVGTLKEHAKLLPGRNNDSMRQRGKELGLPTRAHLATGRYSWVRESIEKEMRNGFKGTVFDMVDIIGGSHRQVSMRIREGHAEKKYYICDWVKSKNLSIWVAVFTNGSKPDVPCPEAKSPSQNSKEYRARRRLKKGKFNPFATAISNVTGVEVISTKGQYKSRVYKEAA